jgi:hypothetical protein
MGELSGDLLTIAVLPWSLNRLVKLLIYRRSTLSQFNVVSIGQIDN